MTMANRATRYPIDALMKGMRSLLVSLPTDEEKRELLRTLDETQRFLEEFRLLVESIPTMESSQELAEGLSRLDILSDRARRDGGLRRLMGFRDAPKSTGRKRVNSVDAEERARRLRNELIGVEGPDIVSALERSGEPLSVLTELANQIGLKTRSKERKAELIGRIATHISNWRGYRLLRGDAPDWTDGADAASV